MNFEVLLPTCTELLLLLLLLLLRLLLLLFILLLLLPKAQHWSKSVLTFDCCRPHSVTFGYY